MPRPLAKDTLQLPEPLRPPRGTLPRTAHLRFHKHPAVPGCLTQAGPGKPRGWLRDGHRELPTAAPKAPPSTGSSLARTLQTSQARSAGVQARARLGWALPAPEYKQ